MSGQREPKGPSAMRLTGAESRAVGLDLIVLAVCVCLYYAPFLQKGLPPGDFASTVAVTAIEDAIIPTPWSFPTWNTEVMCGRPYTGFMSPFIVFRLPFMGMEDIDAMKALMVFFHVLGAFTMYGLLRSLGVARAAAVFAGAVYTVMPSHVTRTGLHGHVQLPMLFAYIPVLFWALFRLKRRDARGVVLLALIIAVGLMRDVQRCLLILVMVGLLLLILAAADMVKRLVLREGAWLGRHFFLGVFLLIASVAAVGFDAVELVGSFSTDPYRGGWYQTEQSYWLSRWSLENLYSVFDWDARLGTELESLGVGIYPSVSRYVGLSLLGLALAGACLPRQVGKNRRRFWFTFALFPMSLWLSFGRSPIWGQLKERWPAVLSSDAVGLGFKLLIVAFPLGVLGMLVHGIARNFESSGAGQGRRARLTATPLRRHLLAMSLLGLGLWLFLKIAPLAFLIEHVFFLRDFRNPDWFQVSLASFAVIVPAALGLDALMGLLRTKGLDPRRACAIPLLLAVGLALVDFLPYRDILTKHQRSAEALEEFERIHRSVGEDDSTFRVLSAERSNSNVDLGYAWNGVPLAWDFRSYTAPRRTQTLMARLHRLVEDSPSSDEIGILADLANVKYILDERGYSPDLSRSRTLSLHAESRRLHAYRNLAWTGFVRAYPEVRLLVGDCGETGANLAARLAGAGVALAGSDGAPSSALMDACSVVYYSKTKTDPAHVPAGAIPFTRREPAHSAPERFVVDPELSWERPEPETIRVETHSGVDFFLQVSESYHPWWTVEVDGATAEVSPAGHAFLGIPVPSGTHVVEFQFQRPAVLPWLFLISLATTAGALAWLVWASRTGRSRRCGENLTLSPGGLGEAA